MIESYSFGSIVINGLHYSHDIKIVHKKVIPEWWRKNGHSVVPEDITDLVEASPEIIILGTGASGMMIPNGNVARLLKSRNIELIQAPTDDAVRIFNRLAGEKKNIAAGFHLTC